MYMHILMFIYTNIFVEQLSTTSIAPAVPTQLSAPPHAGGRSSSIGSKSGKPASDRRKTKKRRSTTQHHHPADAPSSSCSPSSSCP